MTTVDGAFEWASARNPTERFNQYMHEYERTAALLGGPAFCLQELYRDYLTADIKSLAEFEQLTPDPRFESVTEDVRVELTEAAQAPVRATKGGLHR